MGIIGVQGRSLPYVNLKTISYKFQYGLLNKESKVVRWSGQTIKEQEGLKHRHAHSLKYSSCRGTGATRNGRLSKEKHVRGLTLSGFKTYYKVAVIKTVRYCQKKKQIDIWNRIENQQIDLDKHSQLTFDKEQKQISGKKIIFSINGARTTRNPPGKKKEPLQTLHPPKRLIQTDHRYKLKMRNYRTPATSLVVQGFKFCTSTAEGAGSVPGGETKILHSVQPSQKKKQTHYDVYVKFCISTYLNTA